MLSIQKTTDSKKCTPNLLPARINHNGPINNTERYWAPKKDDKGIHNVHFRGRHLHGTPLPLPDSHTGAVLRITDRLAPQTASQRRTPERDDNDEEDLDDGSDKLAEEVLIAEQIGEFDEVVVWGHGGMVDEGADMFVRGVREWIGFAEALHCDNEGETNGEKKT